MAACNAHERTHSRATSTPTTPTRRHACTRPQGSILHYARTIAEAQSGAPVPDAVICVPPYFGHAQRAALVEAAQLVRVVALLLLLLWCWVLVLVLGAGAVHSSVCECVRASAPGRCALLPSASSSVCGVATPG